VRGCGREGRWRENAVALAAALGLVLSMTYSAEAEARVRGVDNRSTSAGPSSVAKLRGKAFVGRRGATAARAPLVGDPVYGINAGGAFFGAPHDQWPGRLAMLRDAGVRMLRMDASWSGMEPTPPLPGAGHVYRFDGTDARVVAMARAGIRPLLMLGYGTPWATPGGEIFTTPSDPANYAAFARAVAQRYAAGSPFWARAGVARPAGGVAYEIWNEPNAQMFLRNQGDAAERFADMLLVGQRAIREVDPGARVITGALVVYQASAFIERVVARQPALREEIRAVGWHPYERTAEAALAATQRFRRSLDRVGLGKASLDVTEFGWGANEMAEPQRSIEVEKVLDGLRDPALRVATIMPYVAMDHGGPDSYGLWNVNGAATASVGALTRVATRSTARAAARRRAAVSRRG